MYNVSTDYKTQIRNGIRNFSYVQIKFGLTDPNARKYGYVSDTSSRLVYSSVPDLIDEQHIVNRYGTLEPGFWILDGTKKTYPATSNPDWQGFVSSNLSNDGGEFTSPPSITIKFNSEDYYRFFGLTFRFDSICNEWPEKVVIKSYRDNTLLDTQEFAIRGTEYTIESGIPSNEEAFLNTLVIEFPNLRLPRRRFRLETIQLGVYRTLDSSSIIDLSWERSNDLMNTTAPIDELSFTFYDVERFYNPENPQGIWSYLDEGQEITTSIGYELEDGTIEWVPAGVHYTDGTPTISDSGVLSKVTFKSKSLLETLSMEYDEGIFSSAGVTYYALAVKLFEFAELDSDKYIISDSLYDYSTKAPLPVLAVKDLLQLIANACMCVLYVNRDDQIVIEPRSTVVNDFVYDNLSVYDNQPNLTKYPVLKSITTYWHTFTKSSESSEIASLEISGATGTQVTVEYECATGISLSASSGLTIDSTQLIASYRAKVTVTGTGTLTVTGYSVTDQPNPIIVNYNVKGESSSIDNVIVTNSQQCRELNSWLSEILLRRNQYKFSERGFPEIDMTDNILIDTTYITEGEATVVKNTITYNGALKATTEVLGK